MEKLLNIKEAAGLLNISTHKLYRLVEARKVPQIRIDGKILFQPAKLEAWIEKCSVAVDVN